MPYEQKALLPVDTSPLRGAALPKAAQYQITEKESDILLHLLEFHYLTVLQIHRVLGSRPASIWETRSRLIHLGKLGLIRKQILPSRSRGLAYIYSLAAPGWKYLEAQGYEVVFKQTPSEDVKEFLFLTHTLRLNDILIAGRLLEKQTPGIVLTEIRHERAMKRHGIAIQYHEGSREVKGQMMPDAFIDFSFTAPFRSKPGRCSVVLELDRSTSEAYQFRKKIRKYVSFVGVPGQSPYQTEFGSDVITIAFVASERGPGRVAKMRTWVQLELAKLEKLDMAHLFLFTHIPSSGEVNTRSFFLSPTWETVNGQKVSLFDT